MWEAWRELGCTNSAVDWLDLMLVPTCASASDIRIRVVSAIQHHALAHWFIIGSSLVYQQSSITRLNQ
jgi:hypothetical protein